MAEWPERRIADFLTEVAQDADKAARVHYDRDTLIDESGLNDRQKEILRSGDLDKIRCAIEYESDATPVCFLWIVG